MKGASAESREIIQMLKQVQHDITVRFRPFCHREPDPEPCSETSKVILNLVQDQGLTILGSRFWVLKFRF